MKSNDTQDVKIKKMAIEIKLKFNFLNPQIINPKEATRRAVVAYRIPVDGTDPVGISGVLKVLQSNPDENARRQVFEGVQRLDSRP